ncbi:hypothetical protein DPMN_008098 [Dreissena polymorpha]|uniref:Uncharacterized protein n=1 Tax=Dreissena polymorpha TaxID=45954 RepID=A0A9D4MZQ6_DREPO|nr:hypothetical protein DPMN_008098 [Dreissena polymorpha]
MELHWPHQVHNGATLAPSSSQSIVTFSYTGPIKYTINCHMELHWPYQVHNQLSHRATLTPSSTQSIVTWSYTDPIKYTINCHMELH